MNDSDKAPAPKTPVQKEERPACPPAPKKPKKPAVPPLRLGKTARRLDFDDPPSQ